MWKQILMTLVAAGYVVSPLDAVPDIIPLFGQMDDAAIAGIALVMWLRWWKKRRAANATVLAR